jgi:hypothetical protein
MSAEIKLHFVTARPVAIFWLTQRRLCDVALGVECCEVLLNLDITRCDKLLALAICREGLAQGEEMFAPIIADEGSSDGFFGSLDPPISHF